MGDESNPVATALGMVAGLAVGAWSLWCTVIAFIGGTMPILGWEVPGGIVDGLVWLIVVDPILITIAYWASMLVILPIVLAITKLQKRGA